MNQNYFPWRTDRHLTPQLFDHSVAKARDERAKAIAAFGQQLIAAASRIAARLMRRRQRLATGPLDQVDPLTR